MLVIWVVSLNIVKSRLQHATENSIDLLSDLTEKSKHSYGCSPNKGAVVPPKLLQLWVEAWAVGCIREVLPHKASFVPRNTNNTGIFPKRQNVIFRPMRFLEIMAICSLAIVHSANSYTLCLAHSWPGIQINNLAWIEYTEKDPVSRCKEYFSGDNVCKPLDPYPE